MPRSAEGYYVASRAGEDREKRAAGSAVTGSPCGDRTRRSGEVTSVLATLADDIKGVRYTEAAQPGIVYAVEKSLETVSGAQHATTFLAQDP